jgi:hypothetical protein
MRIFTDIYTLVGNLSRKVGVYNYVNRYKNNIFFVLYKNELKRNSQLLKNENRKRCFIISSGASINNFNLKLLSNECIIANTPLYKHPDFRDLNVDYQYISAPAFSIQQGHKNGFYINQRINNKKDLDRWLRTPARGEPKPIHTTFSKKPSELFFEMDSALSPNTTIVSNILSKNYIKNNKLFLDNDIFYFLKGNVGNIGIEVDYSRCLGVHDGSMQGCLSLALYLGFKDIYVLGNDYTFDPSLLLHDYDSPQVAKSFGKDLALDYIRQLADYFKADILSISEDNEYYIPVFSRDNDKFDEEHWNMHKIMNQFAKDNSQTIYNVVPEGIDSSVYKKISWSEVVKLTKQTESTSG